MSQTNALMSGCRRTASLETVTPNHMIAERRIDGKREAYKRRNQEYVKAMYGNPVEKEEVRRQNRVALLQQMKEQDSSQRTSMMRKTKESQQAISYDKACLRQDQEERASRTHYLKQFRDENKRLMEERAEDLKREREKQQQYERNLILQSPVNWSHTLH